MPDKPYTEPTVSEVTEMLVKLPPLISKAAQELAEAEHKLGTLISQLDIDKARERIARYEKNPELPSKILESYAITATEAQSKEVLIAKNELEVKKLAHQVLENKYISFRKIANIKNTYSPL
jgi:hypothetical protein